jgi:WD40 repeat protein
MGSASDVVVENEATRASDASRYAYDLFIVHAEADASFVRGYLVPVLNVTPARVLLIDEVSLGGVIVSEIDRSILRSRFTVVVLSPAYLTDRWAVFGEQLASHVSMEDSHVIPLRLVDCHLPLRLAARVSLDFTNPAIWDIEAARLRELLRSVAPPVEHLPCPYPGMRSFTAHDASRFFGREREIDELIGRLDHCEREIYVVGPSGSGKSSLIQAGLLHALEAGSSRLERSFLVRSMRPGIHPAERLSKAIEGDLATPAEVIMQLVARHPPTQRVLIFVDQFEELFTLANSAERQRFVVSLNQLRSVPQCYLLLALRADFLGELLDSEQGSDFARRISPVMVAPLRGAALVHAISAPAAFAGTHVEARLCDRLAADAAEEPGTLPLVQETLRLLWDRRRQRYIGLAAYEALGSGRRGLDVAIARRASAAMAALTQRQEAIARRILLRLVSFGRGRADTRRQQEVHALRSAADDELEFAHVIQHLVEHRLVTLDGNETERSALADLAHEAIITAWPAFGEWIERRRADERKRRRLEARLADWIERGRSASGLLDGDELEDAERWMQSEAAREIGYTGELPALVIASKEVVARSKHQRRLWRLLAAAIVALASVLVVLAWGYQRDAKGHRLLEQGRRLLEHHPVKAFPYLVAARVEGMDSAELREFLGRASRVLPLVTFVGHRAAVTTASFSSDGTRIVTASSDHTARIWDAMTGKLVFQPLEHRGDVTAAAFSVDGKQVVTASSDKTACVWDAVTGRQIACFEHESTVAAAVLHADKKSVTTVSGDWNRAENIISHVNIMKWSISDNILVSSRRYAGYVRGLSTSRDDIRLLTEDSDRLQVWDAPRGGVLASLVGPSTLPLPKRLIFERRVFSSDGARVAIFDFDHGLNIWDVETGNLSKPKKSEQTLRPVVFSFDNSQLLVSGFDSAIVWVYDVSTGKATSQPLVHDGNVVDALFKADGTRVLTITDNHAVQVWDVTTSRPVTSPLEHRYAVTRAILSPDGTKVLTTSADKMARVWDATTTHLGSTSLIHQGWVTVAAFSPDGTSVFTASEDGTARIWDGATGTQLASLRHDAIVSHATFSPDGTRVVTTSRDRATRAWDVMTGLPSASPFAPRRDTVIIAFSSDGRRVTSANSDNTAHMWDAATGNPLAPPIQHEATINSVAFNSTGDLVLTTSTDAARLWNASTGKPVTGPFRHGHRINTASLSPSGTRIITVGNDMAARVWDITTGELAIPPLQHGSFISAASFNADSTRVVTASWDYTAQIWDAKTGAPVTQPLEHRRFVNAAAFSPDGALVVTGSDDNTARLWDAATGRPVTAPLDHQDHVTMATFSADGTRVLTVSNTVARIWTVVTEMSLADDWRRLARCSPFALVGDDLIANPDPERVCRPTGIAPGLPGLGGRLSDGALRR